MRLPMLFLGLVLLLGTGCTGKDLANKKALYPAMDQAWPGVKAHAQVGIPYIPATPGVPKATEPLLEEFEYALKNRDKTVLVREWPPIRVAAEVGIAQGDSSEGIKASRLERVHNFDQAVKQLE